MVALHSQYWQGAEAPPPPPDSPPGYSFIYSDKKYPIQIIMPMSQTLALKPASLRERDIRKRPLSINSSEKTARQESLSIVKTSRKAESMTQSLIESPNLRMLAPISLLSFPTRIRHELGSLMRMPLRGRGKIHSILNLPHKSKLETINISDMTRVRETESLDLIGFIFEDESLNAVLEDKYDYPKYQRTFHKRSFYVWNAKQDSKTCPICQFLNGKLSVWNEELEQWSGFYSPHIRSHVYRPPAHDTCRCTLDEVPAPKISR